MNSVAAYSPSFIQVSARLSMAKCQQYHVRVKKNEKGYPTSEGEASRGSKPHNFMCWNAWEGEKCFLRMAVAWGASTFFALALAFQLPRII